MLKEYNGRLIDDFSNFNRISSFTSNGVNCMPMWAHYSNNHKGYCGAYDMNDKMNISLKGCMFPVQYIDKRLDITEIMENQINNILKEKESMLLRVNETVQKLIKDNVKINFPVYQWNLALQIIHL